MLAKLLIMLLLVSILGPTASACPVCDTDTATVVRAGLADDTNVLTIMAIASPFAIVGGVVAVIHFGIPRRRKHS